MKAAEHVNLDRPKAVCDSEHIDYYLGDCNIILSAPHGGHLKPGIIPDRDAGAIENGEIVYDHSLHDKKDFENLKVRNISDINTLQLTLLVAKELHSLMGKWPHVIINQLHRSKMDANCDVDKATYNVPEALAAWKAFHNSIESAKTSIKGPGLFLDIHGQSHPEAWVELGYTVTASELDTRDFDMSDTSIANLATVSTAGSDLIFGTGSLGDFLSQEGYLAVPSPENPSPEGRNYYTGGYNTIRHGSKTAGQVDGVQIECPAIVRKQDNLQKFANSLARAIYGFWKMHYN